MPYPSIMSLAESWRVSLAAWTTQFTHPYTQFLCMLSRAGAAVL